MANTVKNENIIEMNELYLQLKTYAAVARKVGFSPSTVKKYIINNYVSKEENEKNKTIFKKELPLIKDIYMPLTRAEWTFFLTLDENEKVECDILRKEILV